MVLVFKTNVGREEEVSEVKTLLGSLESVADWNFDLEDRDKILRIVSKEIQPEFIESLLRQSGFYCKELDD